MNGDAGHSTAHSLLSTLAVRRGHFRYESGHHGDLWLDLDPWFANAIRTRAWARSLAAVVGRWRAEIVCGALTGGALLAQLLAIELGAEFVYAERLVATGTAVTYHIPAGQRGRLAGRSTLLVDDAINAGSALNHTLGELDACGATLAGIACLLTLGPAGAEIAARRGVPFASLARVDRQMWTAANCPLCARGVALDPLL